MPIHPLPPSSSTRPRAPLRVALTVDFEPDCPPYLSTTFRGIEQGAPRHASLDVGDFDHDGDVDIAVGTFMLVPGSPPSTNWVEIWENQRAH